MPTSNAQTFTVFPGVPENLRWVHGGLVRSALVIIPQDWMRRREILASATLPGLPIIIVMGGNDGRAFAEQTGLHQLVQDTIVIYLDPVTFEGNNVKFDGGHGGMAPSVIPVDEAGSLAHLLRIVTKSLDDRYNAHRGAMSPYGVENESITLGFRRVVPSVTSVHDPDRIFVFGYSGGALGACRIAAESPLLVPGSAPPVSFTIRAIAMFAGTVGGFRQTETVGATTMLVANVPSTTCSILAIRGATDDQVADEKFYLTGNPGFGLTPQIKLATVQTAAFPAGASYSGRPSGNEYLNRSAMGYTSALAHEMTRWDFTLGGSLQMWADALIVPHVAIPTTYLSANTDSLPYEPDAPGASAASFRWFEFNAGLEPRIHAIVVLGVGHTFPMTKAQAPSNVMGVPDPGSPWSGWNLAAYVVDFFNSF